MTNPEQPGIDSLQSAADYITRYIRTVPDWPAPGVQFQDITQIGRAHV